MPAGDQSEGAGRRPAGIAAAGETFALGALRASLLMCAVIAATGTATAVGGSADLGQVGVGVALTCALGAATARHRVAAGWLRHRGRVTMVVAALAAAIAVDGDVGSPYVAVGFWMLAVAVVVASKREVAVCLVVAELGYVGALLLNGFSPRGLAGPAHASVVAGNMLDFALVAGLSLLVFELLRGVIWQAPSVLAGVRTGSQGFTPALAGAVRRGGTGSRQLPAPTADVLAAELSPTEREVVARLAEGLLPKQVAARRHVSLSTVRSQIAAAKRKTGARTVEQLIAIVLLAEAGG